MAQLDFDTTEITEYTKQLYRLANHQFPKESKIMLNKEAKRLRTITAKHARKAVKKKTGNYFKNIKKGKVYKYQSDIFAVRVYGKYHANLIEYGHRVVRGGKEVGYAVGRNPFKSASQEYAPEFVYAVNKFVSDMLEKGLK